ncbi:MAG: tetratricopeptide repeat protein [Spirochaetes bacterium]|nr:tetratricopeptide repeat protein [Spirochaetota bacterium]
MNSCRYGKYMVYLFLFLLSLTGAESVYAEIKSPGWYETEARKAIEAKNYENAVTVLKEAEKNYPEVHKFNLLLADLYYDKKLFKLALEEYKKAENKGDESYYTLNQIARTFGKLNRDAESITYFKKILKIYPDSMEIYDDLGWMYFKSHQLKKGEAIVLKAMKRYGNNRALAMTLGTIYSGLYNYEKAKEYYLISIKSALKEKDDYFASIAYYNLSLLEHNFYHFNSALKYTNDSIRMADRAPGHLSRGELYQAQMNFKGAMAEYRAALESDRTPLSKINIAILYQKTGRLDSARRYIENVLSSRDLSWMFYYGTDLERHFKDIHEILADCYEGLVNLELGKPVAGIIPKIKSIFLVLKYRLLGYYHRQKFRSYSISVGKAYLNEKDYLDAYWEFYKANEKYRDIALKYLYLARGIEIKITPHSEVYYLQEEGKIKKSVKLLNETLKGFDGFWEREGIVESLRSMIPLLKGRSNAVERRERINRLYSYNRGALLQYGFGLPLEVGFRFTKAGAVEKDFRSARKKRLIIRFLKKSGSEVTETAGEKGFRYRLFIQWNDSENILVRFIDKKKSIVVYEKKIKLKGKRLKVQCADLVNRIINLIYKVG